MLNDIGLDLPLDAAFLLICFRGHMKMELLNYNTKVGSRDIGRMIEVPSRSHRTFD